MLPLDNVCCSVLFSLQFSSAIGDSSWGKQLHQALIEIFLNSKVCKFRNNYRLLPSLLSNAFSNIFIKLLGDVTLSQLFQQWSSRRSCLHLQNGDTIRKQLYLSRRICFKICTIFVINSPLRRKKVRLFLLIDLLLLFQFSTLQIF